MWKLLVLTTICLTTAGICQPGIEWEVLWPEEDESSTCWIETCTRSNEGFLLMTGVRILENGVSVPVVLKYDSHGNLQWSRTGFFRSPKLRATNTSDGGILLISIMRIQEFTGGTLMRLGADGDSLWSKEYLFGYAFLGGLETREGNFVIFAREISNDGVLGRNVGALCVDSCGDSLWFQAFEPDNSQEWRPFLLSLTNGTYLFGCQTTIIMDDQETASIHFINVTGDGEIIGDELKVIAEQTFSLRSIIQTADHCFAMTGLIYSHYSLFKCDSNFEPLWFEGYEFSESSGGYDLRELNDSSLVVILSCGEDETFGDTLVLMRTTPLGHELYRHKFDQRRINHNSPLFIESSDDGSYYIAGTTRENNGSHFWLFKTEPDVWGVDEPSHPLLPAESSFSLFPNPCNQQIGIQLQLTHAGLQTLNIFSSTGRLEREINLGFLPAGESAQVISDPDLCNGVYFVNLVQDGHSAPQPIVILK